MQIYLAAVYSNGYMDGMNRYVKLTDRERDIVNHLPHILESWHYVGKQSFVDHMRNNGAKIFLDSGAFSAHTLGVKLRVEDYCDYIMQNWDILRIEDGQLMASVLDGIGDGDETWRNQQHMEHIFQQHGGHKVRPLPCYHFAPEDAPERSKEPMHYLHSYVQNYEYITLGGMVGATTDQLRKWLDLVWEEALLDGAGRAKIKVHGFGITSRPLMQEYDWYSCDSSSWIQSAAFGGIESPKWGPLSVSGKSPSKHVANQHISNYTLPNVEAILKDLDESGFSYDRLSEVYESRAAYNLWAYGEINKMMDEKRREDYLAGKQQDIINYGRRLSHA